MGKRCRKGCKGLESITFAENGQLNTLMPKAFSGCSSLESITIPYGVTSISGYLFQNCTSLTSVTLPSSVTGIGIYGFYGCSSLESITIPSGVTDIYDFAFSLCSSLVSFTCMAITPPELSYLAFVSASNQMIIYVPNSSIDAYCSADQWSAYSTKIQGI